MRNCLFFFHHAGLLKAVTSTPEPYSIDLETTLRTNLFSDYALLQRPDKTVDVLISLNLLTLNDLV